MVLEPQYTWHPIPSGGGGKTMHRCLGHEKDLEYEIIPIYAETYSRDHPDLAKNRTYVWCADILGEFEPNCSVFIFGSGHPFIAIRV